MCTHVYSPVQYAACLQLTISDSMAVHSIYLLAVLFIVSSVVIGQKLASNKGSATLEWSESQDGYLFCNTSVSSRQSEPWLYCVEDCNRCNLWLDNIFSCNNSTGQVDLLSTYCATFDNDTEYFEIGECAYNEANIHGNTEDDYVPRTTK